MNEFKWHLIWSVPAGISFWIVALASWEAPVTEMFFIQVIESRTNRLSRCVVWLTCNKSRNSACFSTQTEIETNKTAPTGIATVRYDPPDWAKNLAGVPKRKIQVQQGIKKKMCKIVVLSLECTEINNIMPPSHILPLYVWVCAMSYIFQLYTKYNREALKNMSY